MCRGGRPVSRVNEDQVTDGKHGTIERRQEWGQLVVRKFQSLSLAQVDAFSTSNGLPWTFHTQNFAYFQSTHITNLFRFEDLESRFSLRGDSSVSVSLESFQWKLHGFNQHIDSYPLSISNEPNILELHSSFNLLDRFQQKLRIVESTSNNEKNLQRSWSWYNF